MGRVPGHSFVRKFGRNGDVDAAGNEDVWDQGGLYTFSSTNDIDQLTAADDTMTQDIEIQGLDDDMLMSTQTVTLTGNTPAVLAKGLKRSFRMKNKGASNLVGKVYLSTTGAALTAGVPDVASTIRAIINGPANQTLMAIYSVPKGKSGYLIDYYLSGNKNATQNSAGTAELRVREKGGVFQTKHTLTFGPTSAARGKEYISPLPLSEQSDILVHVAQCDKADTIVDAGFDILLVDDGADAFLPREMR
jgi:hypothetical protein